ncbi:MAG: hypothetical protein RBS78_03890 [Coriobacteriia bacterium]|jgi:hypothetical protein|nr:hypothetical protein [Coriobacteriia bacterium]
MAQEPSVPESKRFEPPPWEREQFEELERKLAQRARAAEQSAEVEVADAGERGEDARRRESPPSEPPTPEKEDGATTSRARGAEIETMLMALKAEEGPAAGEVWKLGLTASAFVCAVGVMLVIWGTVALARTQGRGATGTIGAMIMSLMGGLFIGLAAWMGLRSLKQRGER